MCLKFEKYNEVRPYYSNDLKASKMKLTEFDEGLFYALVDKIVVKKDKITVVWKDGTEICV